MSNGWDADGTPRLFCLAPPGQDNAVIPSVFLGYPWPPEAHDPALPTVAFGSSDISMELWALRRYGQSPGADDVFMTGLFRQALVTIAVRGYAAIEWDDDQDRMRVFFSSIGSAEVFPDAPVETSWVSPTKTGIWNYYCINFDRDGNVEIFIDLESKTTASIAGEAGALTGTPQFHPLTSNHSIIDGNSTVEEWYENDNPIFPVMVGPIAIHTRLMTAAERGASYLNKTVQNFGASATAIRFNWREFQGATGWDTNVDRCINSVRAACPVPAAMPQGAQGTVKVLDSSLNDRHWTLRTVADYANYVAQGGASYRQEDGYWPMAFGGEPWIV